MIETSKFQRFWPENDLFILAQGDTDGKEITYTQSNE